MHLLDINDIIIQPEDLTVGEEIGLKPSIILLQHPKVFYKYILNIILKILSILMIIYTLGFRVISIIISSSDKINNIIYICSNIDIYSM